MNLNDFFQYVLFNIGGYECTIGQMVATVFVVFISYFLYFFLSKRLLPKAFKDAANKPEEQKKIKRIIRNIFGLIALLGCVFTLGLNYVFYSANNFDFSISTILEGLLIIQIARILDWIIAKVLLYNYRQSRTQVDLGSTVAPQVSEEKRDARASRIVQYVVYVFAIILILRNFRLDYTLFSFETYDFRVSNIFGALLIILVAQLIIWVLTQLILFGYYKREKVNVGSQYAINQLLTYIIYIIAFFMAFESLGIKMTVLWGGAAALLVGIGLGLQQTFNDFFSGVILLFERSVEVGDTVEINSLTGVVKRIGLRTSIVESRDNVTVVVPNSKLVTDSVINWSHFDDKVRFKINIGVAYGSDTELVKKLLLELASDNIYIMSHPAPIVRFTNFGDSALDFELLFWSRNFIVIEDIKSDMRFEIDKLFRDNNIEIPFPQRDVWIRKQG